MELKRQRLEQEYKLHAKDLYHFLYKLSASSLIAEDLLQDTFVKATIALSKEPINDLRPWLFKVARHAYIDFFRKQKRYSWIPFIEGLLPKEKGISPEGNPATELLDKEYQGELDYFLNQLPEHYRSIWYLREVENFSYQEISEALEISMEQVKVLLHRTRNKLKMMGESRRSNDE